MTTPIQDADIVPAAPAASDSSTILVDLEHTIKTYISDVTRRKEELKKLKEMVASTLTNSEPYRDAEQKAKEAAKAKSQLKTQILKSSENAQIVEKVKDLSAEIKELDQALSDYLREYQRLSGASEIETDDGQVHEIVYVAKLVKRSSKRA